MGTARNFSNTASGASLNGTLAAGATSALLNSFSNFPAAPFTATISRNNADEEIVLVTAVTGSTVTITRGFDGSSAQAHSAGATFEHTAVATDFREAQVHVNATAAHGTTSAVVGVDDVQTLTGKTVKLFKGLANASGAGVEVDNEASTQGKLFRGLNAGVEKFFVDYLGNLTGGSFTGTTASFSGLLTGAAATLSGLLTANGGVTVPTGKKVTLVDAPAAGTDAANKTYTDTGDTAAKAYTDTRETAIKAYSDAKGTHRGAGTSYPASPVEGDTFRRTDLGYSARYDGTTWQPIAVPGRVAKARYTGGSYPLTSGAAYTNLGGGLADLVLTARVGEWIRVGVSYAATNGAGDLRADFVTVKSGAVVSYVSGLGATGHGVLALGALGGRYETAGGSFPYQLTAADVDSVAGTVTLRAQFKADGADRTMFGLTTDPVDVWAQVEG